MSYPSNPNQPSFIQQVQQPPVVKPAKRPSPPSYHDRFASEVSAWITFFSILFYICAGLGFLVSLVFTIILFSNGLPEQALIYFISELIILGLCWLIFRFSMLTLRFMQACIDVLRSINRRLGG